MLLCSFGTFDSAFRTLHGYSNNTFNIQQYYTIDLCIVINLNFEILSKKMTSSLLIHYCKDVMQYIPTSTC